MFVHAIDFDTHAIATFANMGNLEEKKDGIPLGDKLDDKDSNVQLALPGM